MSALEEYFGKPIEEITDKELLGLVNEHGLCKCGCGQKTEGDYRRGHRSGGAFRDQRGRIRVHMPKHPRANTNGYIYEHRIIAEEVLGRPLPPGVEIHHIDGNSSNNEKRNLVICENRTYHKLLHIRKAAYEACGNVNWRKCQYCQQYDAPENLVMKDHRIYHGPCRSRYVINLRK